MNWKRYIGDGVYADFDGYHIVLATDRAEGGQHKIYLEPAVFHALVDMANEIQEAVAVESSEDA
jgi:hypothetical protein